MSGLSRRGLLAGTAGVAASFTIGDAPAVASATPGPETRLAALAQEFAEALATLHAAEQHRNACETRYLQDGPEIPAALRRGGPLGKLLQRKWEWWNADDLVWLLENGRRRKHWPAARELLPIAQAYDAADKRFARDCGFAAAEAAQEAAMDALADLTDAVLGVPPDTPAALALKARVVKAWGRPELWSDDEHGDATDRLIAQVLDGVMRIGARQTSAVSMRPCDLTKRI